MKYLTINRIICPILSWHLNNNVYYAQILYRDKLLIACFLYPERKKFTFCCDLIGDLYIGRFQEWDEMREKNRVISITTSSTTISCPFSQYDLNRFSNDFIL